MCVCVEWYSALTAIAVIFDKIALGWTTKKKNYCDFSPEIQSKLFQMTNSWMALGCWLKNERKVRFYPRPPGFRAKQASNNFQSQTQLFLSSPIKVNLVTDF